MAVLLINNKKTFNNVTQSMPFALNYFFLALQKQIDTATPKVYFLQIKEIFQLATKMLMF